MSRSFIPPAVPNPFAVDPLTATNKLKELAFSVLSPVQMEWVCEQYEAWYYGVPPLKKGRRARAPR